MASLLSGPLALLSRAAVVSPVSGSTTTWALNPSWRRSVVLWACRVSGSTVEITRSGATLRAIRHLPSVPSDPSAGSTSCPATSASNAIASAAVPPAALMASTASPSSSARASLTSADTSASRAASSSQAIRGFPGQAYSWPVQRTATTSAAPGTSRATRRTAATSWVMVSWRATASSSTVESNARRFRPETAPVSQISCRTTSKIRCGRSLAASRRRQ